MEKFLPRKKVYETHGQLLKSSTIQHFVFPKLKNSKPISKTAIKKIIESVDGCELIYIREDTYIGSIAFFKAPDNKGRHGALDMAYKLRGEYSPEKVEIVRRKYEDMSDEELEKHEKELKAFLNKK